MKDVILLVRKMQKGNNGREFPIYYCYRQVLNEVSGEYEDLLTPGFVSANGDIKPRAISIKVKPTKHFEEKYGNCKFPMFVEIDDEVKGDDGKSQYFMKPDKDNTGKVRLDKYGNKHLLMVLHEVSKMWEAPVKSYSIDDVDTYR